MDLIAVGAVRKPHGVHGEASVEPLTNSLERLAELKEVVLVAPDESSRRSVTVESFRLHGDRALMRFSGFSTPEEVAEIRGWTVEIPLSSARALEEDEYFLHDLVGLRLIDDSGKERGEVVDAFEGGGGVLLTVRHGSRKFDVPFAAAICKTIDLEARTIVVDLPEGIDEV